MNDEPPGPGVPPPSDDAMPRAPEPSPGADATPTEQIAPGSVPEMAVSMTQRTIVGLFVALFLFGSCGIAYGVYRLANSGDGDASPTPPVPAPSVSVSPSASPSVSPSASPIGEPLPDLLVADLTGRSVTVRNIGIVAAGRFVLSVAGRAFIADAGLEPGAEASFSFPCKEGPLTATADSTGRVTEAVEDNNALTAGPFDCASPTVSPTVTASPSAEPKLPDLVVTRVSFDQVVVANQGNGPAGAFLVIAGKAGTFDVDGLGAGLSTTISFPCTEGTIVAEADSARDVPESNEGNNRRSGGPFQCLPDLIVSNLGLDSVTVANQGIGAAGPSVVVVQGFAIQVPALQPGERATFTYQCVGGNVTAIADARDQVQESNEGNNETTADVGQCSIP